MVSSSCAGNVDNLSLTASFNGEIECRCRSLSNGNVLFCLQRVIASATYFHNCITVNACIFLISAEKQSSSCYGPITAKRLVAAYIGVRVSRRPSYTSPMLRGKYQKPTD